MNWLLFAILSPAIYTVVIFIDKYIVEREVPDYRGMVIFSALMGLLAGTLFWVLGGFPLLSARNTLLILVTGMLTVWSAALYFTAIMTEASSNVIVLFQITPVMVLVLSFVFLRETLFPKQLLGFVLILVAAVGVSLRQAGGGRIRLSRAFFLILVVDLMTAAAFVLFKFVSGEQTFSALIAYESWGIALGGLLLYLAVPTIRHAFNYDITHMRRRGMGAIFANEGMFVIGKLFAFLAVSLGSASLVSVLQSTQVFFGIFVGWVLTLAAPAVFQEDITRRGLARKGLLAGVMFTGLLLVG